MFWQKRTTHKLPLLVFGLIALAIIISTTILIIQLVKQEDNLSDVKTVNNLSNKISSLEAEYLFEMEKLQILANEDTSVVSLGQIKSNLLTIRVPKEYREAHLQVFLGVLRLEDDESLSEEDKKMALKKLFSPIIKKENAEISL